MNSNEQYPVRVEKFGEMPVPFLEVNGQDYLTGEDLGRCLGFADPGQSVGKMFRRHRDEMEKYTLAVNLTVNPLGRPIERLYSETACNLAGMLAKTRIAKEFRLWLARLPRRARELVNGQAVRQAFELGLEQGLKLLEDLPTEILSLEDLGQLIALRRLGFTQMEAANSLGVPRDAVQVAEKLLKARGLEFTPVRQGPRRKRFRALAARALCDVNQIPPSPPLLKGGEEAGHGAAAG